MQKPVRNVVGTLVLGIGMAGLAGCGSDPTSSTTLSLRIASAEAKWRDAGLKNYSFNSLRTCFCIEEFRNVRITVRAGAVASVVDLRTGVARPVTFFTPIDSLFGLLRREALENPSRLSFSVDARFGYPRVIEYGNRELDGGASLAIDSLKAEP